MPDLVEQMYCGEQIVVPTMFPYILKQYAKAAIRTQPYDLLKWSASYFAAMANGEEPPVKHRIEYPPIEAAGGLTQGYLRVLLKQLGLSGTVPVQTLYDKWTGVCLQEDCLTNMIQIGAFGDEVNWLHFLGIAAGHLTDSLSQTMCLVCELLTEEPDGGSAMIRRETFVDIYGFLAALDCGPYEPVTLPAETEPSMGRVGSHLSTSIKSQALSNSVQPHVSASAKSTALTSAKSEALASVESHATAGGKTEAVASNAGMTEVLSNRSHAPNSIQQQVSNSDKSAADNSITSQVSNSDKSAVMSVGDKAQAKTVTGAMQDTATFIGSLFSGSGRSQFDPDSKSVQTEHWHVPGIGPTLDSDQVTSVLDFLGEWAARQEGMVMPRNIRHYLCPPLDKLPVPERNSGMYYYPKSNVYPQVEPTKCAENF